MTHREARRLLGSRTVRRRHLKTYAINYDGKGGKAVKARYPRPVGKRVRIKVREILKKALESI